jgi:hypothetical protein
VARGLVSSSGFANCPAIAEDDLEEVRVSVGSNITEYQLLNYVVEAFAYYILPFVSRRSARLNIPLIRTMDTAHAVPGDRSEAALLAARRALENVFEFFENKTKAPSVGLMRCGGTRCCRRRTSHFHRIHPNIRSKRL